MAIKVSIGKLNVPLPFTRLVRQHVTGNNIDVLPIEPEHLDEQRECLSIIGIHLTGLLSRRRSQKRCWLLGVTTRSKRTPFG